jgi:hypothetical protein
MAERGRKEERIHRRDERIQNEMVKDAETPDGTCTCYWFRITE